MRAEHGSLKRGPRGVSPAVVAIAALAAVVMFFPIAWIVSSSFKTLVGISAWPPTLFPRHPTLENYLAVLTRVNLGVYLRNTLILIVGNTLGTLLSSALVAYPLARMEFRGKKVVFGLILATMMVPSTAIIIPQYILFGKLGWLNSFLPMIVPAFFAYPYNVFLFRQYYRTIPMSISESAFLDGCSHFQILARMIVPLSRSIFVTIGVLSAVFWWNEMFTPLIYIDSDDLKPLVLGALSIFKINFISRWDWQMAMSVLMVIPPIALYLVAQKQLVEGIKTSGMKG
jgi:multiple sugar transport system permease protein